MKNKTFLAAVIVLLAGMAVGGSATYIQLDSRIDSLNDKVGSGNSVVYVNHSGGADLTEIFENSDQSVVSIRTQGSSSGQGSGFIYSESGYIVTNEHVISDADQIEVTFIDGTTARAEIIGRDVYTDLAVLKVPENDLEALELGNSSQVEVGQQAIAIGNPFGLRGSMTSGIISQKGRLIPVAGGFSIHNVLQTDASINPGNSGGPLLNSRGEVVGVNTAIETNTGTFSGVGFAIPVNAVKRVVPEIIESGEYEHSWIGVTGIDVGPDIAEARNLERTKGFMLMEIVDDGPAADSELQVNNHTVELNGQELNVGGDIIVGMEGREVRGLNDILTYLASDTSAGDEVTFTVLRYQDGENVRRDVTVTLGSRPEVQ